MKSASLVLVGSFTRPGDSFLPTQAERLAQYFAKDGCSVMIVSQRDGRTAKLLEIVMALVRNRAKIDVIHIQVNSGMAFVIADVASLIGQALGFRIVMTLRGGALPRFTATHPRWVSRVLRRADVVTAPSAFLAREMSNSCGSVRVIPNVIDLGAYPFRRRTVVAPRILWLRAFHEIYNPQLAVRVIERVRRELPQATLVMAGPDKGEFGRTRELARQLGVEDAVAFVGFLDRQRKVAESAAADIFLHTSRVDNTPVSVLEACAFGLVIVATRVGGMPDLLEDGRDALLVDNDDVDAMAAAVIRLVRTPGLAARFSANARSVAERGSWEQVRPLWLEAFGGLGNAPEKSVGPRN